MYICMGFILGSSPSSPEIDPGPLNQQNRRTLTSVLADLVVPMASKALRKVIHQQKLYNHLKTNTQILIVGADNLCANQIQAIRQGLRGESAVVMGKNTLMKRSIAIHAPVTGKPAFLGVIPHIVGKVGLVMTAGDPDEVSEAIAGYKLQPWLCSSMDIGICSQWQWLLGTHLNLLNNKSSNL